MEQAIIGLLIGLGGLLTAGGIGARLLFQRMETLERESAAYQEKIRKERDDLRRQVADLEARVAKVPQLEKQVDTLIQQLAEMQKRQEETEKALAEANNREKALQRENEELRAERDKWKREAHDLKTANATYERALALLGMERLDREKAEAAPVGDEINEAEQPKQEGDG